LRSLRRSIFQKYSPSWNRRTAGGACWVGCARLADDSEDEFDEDEVRTMMVTGEVVSLVPGGESALHGEKSINAIPPAAEALAQVRESKPDQWEIEMRPPPRRRAGERRER